jgi:hypothetical protein
MSAERAPPVSSPRRYASPRLLYLAQRGFAPRAELLRYQAEPRGHLTTILKVTGIGDGDRHSACSHRAHPDYRLDALRLLTLLSVGTDLDLAEVHALLEPVELFLRDVQESAHARRQSLVLQ